jgi:hypothetical protein
MQVLHVSGKNVASGFACVAACMGPIGPNDRSRHAIARF